MPHEQPPANTPKKEKISLFDNFNDIPFDRMNEPRLIQGENGSLIFGTDEGFNYKNRNEDRLVINTNKNAFAVIDGMGGYDFGDQAAQILAEQLQSGFVSNLTFKEIQHRAAQLMKKSNLGRNGACYIAFRIKDTEMEIAQAGDVRLLIINKNDEIKFTTRDEGQGHSVYNCVQGSDFGRTTISRTYIEIGDRIIVASDGITDNLDNEELVELLHGKTPVQAMEIIAEATQNMMIDHSGKPDNRTLLIYDIERLRLSESAESETSEAIPDFTQAKSFPELFTMLDQTKTITGSTQEFPTVFLKKIINYVRSSVLRLTAITTAGGLRTAVMNLITRYENFRLTETETIFESQSRLEKKCQRAKNLDELIEIILLFEYSVENQDAKQIAQAITKVREGQEVIDILPTPFWLRNKVRNLLRSELEKKYFSK